MVDYNKILTMDRRQMLKEVKEIDQIKFDDLGFEKPQAVVSTLERNSACIELHFVSL